MSPRDRHRWFSSDSEQMLRIISKRVKCSLELDRRAMPVPRASFPRASFCPAGVSRGRPQIGARCLSRGRLCPAGACSDRRAMPVPRALAMPVPRALAAGACRGRLFRRPFLLSRGRFPNRFAVTLRFAGADRPRVRDGASPSLPPTRSSVPDAEGGRVGPGRRRLVAAGRSLRRRSGRRRAPARPSA